MAILFKHRSNPSEQQKLSESAPEIALAQPAGTGPTMREQELEAALLALAAYFAEGTGDLTRPLALGSADPAVTQAETAVQRWIETVRTMRLQLEEMTVTTAGTAARSGHLVRETAGHMDDAHQRLEQAAGGVTVCQDGVAGVAKSAAQAAALADQARGVTDNGAAVIAGAIGSISRIQEEISQVQARVGALVERSAEIARVSQVIETIAKKTHLLSLNAAIEAARAGEHGRGFSVVAADVRNLADSTSRQTKEIRQLISGISADLEQTRTAIDGGRAQADEGVALAEKAAHALGEIQQLVGQVAEPLTEIAGTAEEQSAALEQAAESLNSVTGLTGKVADQARSVAGMTSGLAGMSEAAFSSLTLFRCGSPIDDARAAAEALATEARQVLEAVVDRGEVSLDSLLDLTYMEYKGALVDKLKHLWGDVSRAPRTGFTPPKYATAYDSLVDVPLRDVLDRYKEANPWLRFVVCSDLNGYSAAQNGAYCKAWTGDPKVDLHSRVKQMNCDGGQVRACRMGLSWSEREPLMIPGQADVRNMKTVHSRREFLAAGCNLQEPAGGDRSVLMQTFTRHTGTVVNLLSVPLYVKGQRYGGIILGWLPPEQKI
jgi:methyl-accepting chemotaxis protein